MQVRRVVTGQVAGGKSIVVSDEEVATVTVSRLPGTEFLRLWGSDSTPQLPTDGSQPPPLPYFPTASGVSLRALRGRDRRGPAGGRPRHRRPASALQEKVPGLAELMEPDNPGMHTTDTVDFDYIISGEVWLELDDGQQVHLQAGDCVIQNGARHAWRNKSSEPCVVAVAIVGARRVSAV